MARPKKIGLDYFPFDVDFFLDQKIKRLRARFGRDGIVVYLYILCEIYRNGYYIDYNEDLILDISGELNISENCTMQIMNYLFSRSLLDGTLAKSVKVLTASSIQRRYQEAKKNGKTDIYVDARFWVLKKEETHSFIKVRHNDDYSENNEYFSKNNLNKSTKNDTKESKVKKSKVKESKEETADKPPTASCKIDYNSIFELFNRICKSYSKITAYSEARKKAIEARFESGYTVDDFKTAFEKAENSDFLKGKNSRNWSANFDWLIKDENIAKVLDGNYDDKSSNKQKEYSFDLDEYKGLMNDFGDEENE